MCISYLIGYCVSRIELEIRSLNRNVMSSFARVTDYAHGMCCERAYALASDHHVSHWNAWYNPTCRAADFPMTLIEELACFK